MNIGTRSVEHIPDIWGETEWDEFMRTTPNESHVMNVAGVWSIDPSSILDQNMSGNGLFGDFDEKLTALQG
jgi:hypothetical protein